MPNTNRGFAVIPPSRRSPQDPRAAAGALPTAWKTFRYSVCLRSPCDGNSLARQLIQIKSLPNFRPFRFELFFAFRVRENFPVAPRCGFEQVGKPVELRAKLV